MNIPNLQQGVAVVLVFALAAGASCKRQDRTAAGDDSRQERSAAPEATTPYYQGLIDEYRSILAEDPHNLAAVIALGNAYYDAHQWKGAIHYYEQALTIDPHSADVMTDMGTSYRSLGMIDKAIETYERAVSIEPGHQNALFNLGVVYGQDKKDYRKAIAAWDQLLHIAPKHPQADTIKSSLHAYRQALRKQSP
ncbi:MAG: tetratricopeptide repeat protein [Nitrospirota bacterium]|nr:tetratricopeptide repeat protein [Nitrospirota bacterium]